jgi:uncharacterized protein YndB with AHSA1/START domain
LFARNKAFPFYKTPVEKVYKSILTTEGLTGWWTENALSEQTVGGVAEFNFDERYNNKMRITNFEENKTIE